MRLPRRQAAVLVDLNASTRIIMYGRGSVDVLRGREVFHISDVEMAKMVAVHERFVAGDLAGDAEELG